MAGQTSLSELLAYRGDPNLAGGINRGGVYGIGDFSRPLDAVDRFTAFTMQNDRDQWVNNNLLMQKQAEEAAKRLDVQYGDLIPEDRGQIDDAVRQLYDFYNQNPNAVSYMVDPKDPTKNNTAEYNKFLQLRQNLDHLIVRGNLRAQQLGKIQDERAKITDPDKLKSFDQAVVGERQKRIQENLLLPPNMVPFNGSSYLEEAAKAGDRSYEFLQKFPNNTLIATKGLFDPNQALAYVMRDLSGNDTRAADLKKDISQRMAVIQGVLNQHRVPDGQGGTVLDMKGLMADPNAAPFLQQIQQYNQQVGDLNNQDWVEGGRKTGKKVREFLGYNQDIPLIDVNNITPTDVIRMGLAYKMGIKTSLKNQQTNEALDWARIAEGRRQFDLSLAAGDKTPEELAQEKILTYYNTFSSPETLGGQPVYEYQTRNVNGVKTQVPGSGKYIGHELSLTPQLSDIFSIPQEKTKTTTKTPSASGVDMNAGFGSPPMDATQVEQKYIRPTRVFVTAGDKGDINTRRIRVRYENGTSKEFTPQQAFPMFNKLFGDDDKTQSALSAASMKALANKYGLSQPDLRVIGKKIGQFGKTTPVNDEQQQKGNYADLFK